jgi:alpha-mannosidase
VLLNQFHDILPGTSIAWVHQEAERTYAAVAVELEALTAAALAALGVAGAVGAVANAAPHDRTEVVTLPDGARVVVTVPGSGVARLGSADVDPAEPPALPGAGEVVVRTTKAGIVLANGLLTVVVDADGLLASVRDEVADREVLAPGARGNLLQLHTDFPNHWDAWDVDQHYRHQVTDLVHADAVDVVDAGPLVGSVVVRRSFRSSAVTQTYVLRAGSGRLDVRTELDWHEQEKLLKATFGLDVHADRSASEIQFGHVYRPTHANTSWDAARFEVVMHRWVHVGEPGYGVAVANDASYGHDTTRTARPDGGSTTTVRLSLVRGPRVPDPQADQGAHTMTYSLVPGADLAAAVRAGHDLNLPLRLVSPTPLPSASISAGAAGAGPLPRCRRRWSRSAATARRWRRSSSPRTAPAMSSSGSTRPGAVGPGAGSARRSTSRRRPSPTCSNAR